MRETKDGRVVIPKPELQGVALAWQPYAPSSPNNDHDHCEFCRAKFMRGDTPDALNAGYATADGYYWIGKTCFDDSVGLFEWVLDGPT